MNLWHRIPHVILLVISIFLIGASHSSAGASHGILLVVNKADRTLSLVDPEAGREMAALPVGGVTAHEVAASPDGKTAWVPIYGNSGVGRPGTDGAKLTVIDLASRKTIDTLNFDEPTRPHCALFGPRDGKLYLTAELSRSIDRIDPATRKVVDRIPTGEPESHMLAISSDGKRGYTANVGSGTVSVLDLEHRKLLKIIPISKNTQRIAISPDNQWVFTADQTKPELAIIDTATNSVSKRAPLPDFAFGTAPTRDGRWLLMTQPRSNKIAVLNLQTMKVDKILDVPPAPQEILIRPDNQVAYVSCDRSKQVAVVNLSSWKVDKLIEVGEGADGLAWAVQP